MGHPDGAHTHGSGFDPVPVLIVLGAALIAGPVLAAVAELVHIFLIIAVVLLVLGAAGLVAFIAYRVRHLRRSVTAAARVIAPLAPRPARATRPLPEPQREALGQPGGLHLHLHGVSAEDVAAILRARGQP